MSRLQTLPSTLLFNIAIYAGNTKMIMVASWVIAPLYRPLLCAICAADTCRLSISEFEALSHWGVDSSHWLLSSKKATKRYIKYLLNMNEPINYVTLEHLFDSGLVIATYFFGSDIVMRDLCMEDNFLNYYCTYLARRPYLRMKAARFCKQMYECVFVKSERIIDTLFVSMDHKDCYLSYERNIRNNKHVLYALDEPNYKDKYKIDKIRPNIPEVYLEDLNDQYRYAIIEQRRNIKYDEETHSITNMLKMALKYKQYNTVLDFVNIEHYKLGLHNINDIFHIDFPKDWQVIQNVINHIKMPLEYLYPHKLSIPPHYSEEQVIIIMKKVYEMTNNRYEFNSEILWKHKYYSAYEYKILNCANQDEFEILINSPIQRAIKCKVLGILFEKYLVGSSDSYYLGKCFEILDFNDKSKVYLIKKVFSSIDHFETIPSIMIHDNLRDHLFDQTIKILKNININDFKYCLRYIMFRNLTKEQAQKIYYVFYDRF